MLEIGQFCGFFSRARFWVLLIIWKICLNFNRRFDISTNHLLNIVGVFVSCWILQANETQTANFLFKACVYLKLFDKHATWNSSTLHIIEINKTSWRYTFGQIYTSVMLIIIQEEVLLIFKWFSAYFYWISEETNYVSFEGAELSHGF